jgi:hypothetical protein
MPATYRVEWLGIDHEGNQHRYVSPNFSQADAAAFAATIRKSSSVSAVQILDAEAAAQ